MVVVFNIVATHRLFDVMFIIICHAVSVIIGLASMCVEAVAISVVILNSFKMNLFEL